MTSPIKVRRRIDGTVVLLVLIVQVVLIGLAVVATERTTNDLVDEPSTAFWMSPQRESGTVSQQVTASVTASVESTAMAPAWEGTVTAVLAQAGELVQAGTPVLSINGRGRVICASDFPLYRAIGLGDVGADVDAIAECLVTGGLWTRPDGWGKSFDETLQAAASELDLLLGGDGTRTGVDPSDVLWTTSLGWTLGRVNLAVGDIAPASRATVLSAAPTLQVRWDSEPLNRAEALVNLGDQLQLSASIVTADGTSLDLPAGRTFRSIESRFQDLLPSGVDVAEIQNWDASATVVLDIPADVALLSLPSGSLVGDCINLRPEGARDAVAVTVEPLVIIGQTAYLRSAGVTADADVLANPYANGVTDLCSTGQPSAD